MGDPSRVEFNIDDFGINVEFGMPDNQNTTIPHIDNDTPPSQTDSFSSSPSTSSTTTGAKSARRKTSAVWDPFDEVTEMIDGVAEVREHCKRCGNGLSTGSTGGTDHLRRHTLNHAKKDEEKQSQTMQTTLQFKRNFSYDANVQRE